MKHLLVLVLATFFSFSLTAQTLSLDSIPSNDYRASIDIPMYRNVWNLSPLQWKTENKQEHMTYTLLDGRTVFTPPGAEITFSNGPQFTITFHKGKHVVRDAEDNLQATIEARHITLANGQRYRIRSRGLFNPIVSVESPDQSEPIIINKMRTRPFEAHEVDVFANSPLLCAIGSFLAMEYIRDLQNPF
ncbi:MAG: hypothetical protein AAGJ82_02570 [Bacteroidota bacterium]